MTGLENGAAAAATGAIPAAGKKTSGSNAVTGNGRISEIQNVPINTAPPSVRHPVTVNPSGAGAKSVNTQKAIPAIAMALGIIWAVFILRKAGFSMESMARH